MRQKGNIMKKNSMFAKGMALVLALLMVASVVFAVVAYIK